MFPHTSFGRHGFELKMREINRYDSIELYWTQLRMFILLTLSNMTVTCTIMTYMTRKSSQLHSIKGWRGWVE